MDSGGRQTHHKRCALNQGVPDATRAGGMPYPAASDGAGTQSGAKSSNAV